MYRNWPKGPDVVYEGRLQVKPLLPHVIIYRTVINHPTVGNQAGVWLVVANGFAVQHSLS